MQNEEEQEEKGGDGEEIHSFAIFTIARRLPFQIALRIPFTKHYLNIGHHTLETLRKRVQRNPKDADARITLAAHLLSQDPMTVEHAEEAARELIVSLTLLPTKADHENYEPQTYAMVHLFLGNALLKMGNLSEAREHWQQTIELDPVRPPWGLSGEATELLRKHPE